MRPFLIALLIFIISGCSESVWTRPDWDEETFYRENGQCSAMADSISRPYPGQLQRVYESCMRGKGWRLIQKKR
jgi:hypothetical protein